MIRTPSLQKIELCVRSIRKRLRVPRGMFLAPNRHSPRPRDSAKMLTLANFSVRKPRYQIAQSRALEWLCEIHTAAQTSIESLAVDERAAFSSRISRLISRVACGPDKIGTRGHVSADLGATDWDNHALYDVTRNPRGRGTATRSKLFSEIVNHYFEHEYADERAPPSELIHVTCTGYVAPSGAQYLVAKRAWGELTHVTHAYHMGCYAAFPAIRMAAGHLGLPQTFVPSGTARRADIVHTELCTLHLDPSDHSAEQCVLQSLFGDGFVRYSLLDQCESPGLDVLALSEAILKDSGEAMGWSTADFGLRMTLARDVPDRIGRALRPFVDELFQKAGRNLAEDLRRTLFAVHPGGPKIIDRVRDVLELSEAQLQTSRDVLFNHGNMSSATLPHVWQQIVADPAVAPETLVLSLAFGPGLTVCGGLFRKR